MQDGEKKGNVICYLYKPEAQAKTRVMVYY